MKMINSCLAIIPARGGSKGVKNKNIKRLNGKPLIYYTIRVAKKAKCIDRVIVSTDSEEIKKIALKFGAEVSFLRPRNLSTDKTPMYPVIRHALEFLEKKGERFNIIVVLQPTSPLRRAIDIQQAIAKLIKTGADSIASVCLSEHSPFWMKVIKQGKIYPIIKSRQYSRRQDLPKVYRLNGAIYITKRDVLKKQKRILGANTQAFVMPVENSIDINTGLEFKIAAITLRDGGCYLRG